MDVNVVWGPPASGKTTFVNENRSGNSITFDFDMLMRTLSGLSPHEKNPNLVGYLLDIRGLIVERLKTEKRLDDAWIIVSWVDDNFRSLFNGIDAQYTLMETPQDVCLQRVDDNKDRHIAADEMKRVINEWFDKYNQHYRGGVMKTEKRAMPFEMRMETAEDSARVIGAGAVYNKRSQDLGGFFEIIREGAFKRSLESGRVIKSFVNHDPNQVLGTTESNPPLTITDDKRNMGYEVEIPDTSYGKDLRENLKRGNIKGSSFQFRTIEDNWYKDDKGETVREVISAELFEVGPVTDPAYLPTISELRTLKDSKDEFEAREAEIRQKEEEKEKARRRRMKEVEILQARR